MSWNLDSDRPIFVQILERIRMDIISGKYKPGDKLPSVRELAAEAAVNPNTMQRAFAELERSGLVYSQRTSGRFITENQVLIRQIREEVAQESINSFLQNMKQLGYEETELLDLIKKKIGS